MEWSADFTSTTDRIARSYTYTTSRFVWGTIVKKTTQKENNEKDWRIYERKDKEEGLR